MIELVEIEGPAGHQPHAPQQGQHRLVRGVRRVLAQQFRGVGEERVGRHCVHLLAHRNVQVQRRVGLRPRRLRGQVPLRQRRQDETVLQRVGRGQVRGAVSLDQRPGPDVDRGRVDARHAGRQHAAPARRHDGGMALGRAGAARAQRGEHVRPHVQQRQRVAPALGVGHGQHDGPGRQVDPARAAQHVGIGPRRGVARARQGAPMQERVGRRASLSARRVGELAPGQVHGDQRVEIQIAFHRRLLGRLGRGGGRRRLGGRRLGEARRRQGEVGGGQQQGQGGKAAHRRSNGHAEQMKGGSVGRADGAGENTAAAGHRSSAAAPQIPRRRRIYAPNLGPTPIPRAARSMTRPIRRPILAQIPLEVVGLFVQEIPASFIHPERSASWST